MARNPRKKCASGFYHVIIRGIGKQIIRDCPGMESGTQLQAVDREDRDAALRTLKQKGLSVRQIERLTGITPSL